MLCQQKKMQIKKKRSGEKRSSYLKLKQALCSPASKPLPDCGAYYDKKCAAEKAKQRKGNVVSELDICKNSYSTGDPAAEVPQKCRKGLLDNDCVIVGVHLRKKQVNPKTV